MPRFIGANIYRGSSYGAHHPLRVARVSTVIDLARAMGWFQPGQYVNSPRARPAALQAWHDPAYLAVLQRAEAGEIIAPDLRKTYNIATPSNPIFPEMFRRPATAAGGSILAGQMLRDGGVVHSPGGGTHHGMPDRANGFCYLNDPVLAVLSLRDAGVRRVAYVDIDAHHPDGVEHGLGDDADVLMISVHEERRWPFTGDLQDRGAGQVWNLPVPRGFNDTEMQAVLDSLILPRLAAFRPEAIVLQCGADAVLEDPLSRLTLSNNAHVAVVNAVRALSPRLLVLGGGGYNPWSVGRCWARVWAALNGYEVPDHLPEAAQAVLRGLVWTGHRDGKTPPVHWFTTLADAPRPGPVGEEVRARLSALEARARVWV
ncbi:acetoin utilization protein AcuC [Oceaniglobus ichthyenteri]|uniref:acetoin utilization protein AcuC n=1 Tax=Oceaniglobus ichthyenteri TaxID=2136177 RepID=UPI003B830951